MYYIGVDLGGTNIAAGLLTEDGEILYKDKVPTYKDKSRDRKDTDIIKDMAELCLSILEKNNLTTKDIQSIGIGSPGTCDYKNGIVTYSNNLKFKNTPVRDEMQKYIDLPVYVDNDANCAAYGESIRGACRNTRNSVTVTLGTGVGSGAVVNGQIVRGAYGMGCEFGHHVIVVNGEYCTCGRYGCFEAYASATALIREIKKAASNNPKSLINELVNNNLDLIEAKTVFDANEKNDETAKEVIDVYINYVAEGFTNLINIFDPEIIAVGGGVAGQGEKILVPIREKVKEKCYGGVLNTKIIPAELGNDAGIIGAGLLKEFE